MRVLMYKALSDFDRDEVVAAAIGTKSHNGITYNTVAKNITGIMPAGSDGVNHGKLCHNCIVGCYV